MKSQLKKSFPKLWQRARVARQASRLMPRLFGHHPRTCAICGYEGMFFAEIHFPDIFTYDALCPQCGSLPRNRLLVIAADREALVTATDRVLHFAPEAPVTAVIRPRAADYVTADIDPRGVDVRQDIEALSFADREWDVIICSHVLEHVDHRKALAELFRVLRPGGRLLALFPVVEAWSDNYENAAVTSRHDRAIHFGKDNHHRRFGHEVHDDFTRAGFDLQCFTVSGDDSVRYGLIPGETLFIGRKA